MGGVSIEEAGHGPDGRSPAVPVACTLGAGAALARLEEWRHLLAQAVANVDRAAPEQLRLRLLDGADHLIPLVRLAQQEKECCPFFDFTFVVATDAVELVVGVPTEAAAVLDDFSRLLTIR